MVGLEFQIIVIGIPTSQNWLVEEVFKITL